MQRTAYAVVVLVNGTLDESGDSCLHQGDSKRMNTPVGKLNNDLLALEKKKN